MTTIAASADTRIIVRGACPHDGPDPCARFVSAEDGRVLERLTEFGRGPTFYDCMVEVEACA